MQLVTAGAVGKPLNTLTGPIPESLVGAVRTATAPRTANRRPNRPSLA